MHSSVQIILAGVRSPLKRNLRLQFAGKGARYRVTILPGRHEDPYDLNALNAALDPAGQNILCIGVAQINYDAACSLVTQLRTVNSNQPVMALHDYMHTDKRLQLLAAGFDDVQPSSAGAAQVADSIRALGRRYFPDIFPTDLPPENMPTPLELHWSGSSPLTRKLERLSVRRGARERNIRLSPLEAQVLAELARKKGEFRTQGQLYEALYPPHSSQHKPQLQIVKVCISKLRHKIGKGLLAAGLPHTGKDILLIDRKLGYRFNPALSRNMVPA